MKILFAGTPSIAVPSLETLIKGFSAAGVLTNPDKVSGRGKIRENSPVKECALKYGLKVFQPEHLDSAFISEIKKENFDTLVTFAYGKIFKEDFLSLFKLGAFNIHPSLLPLHRGASPLNAAILKGDRETGITIQKIFLKTDSGDIGLQYAFPLNGTETLSDLCKTVSLKSAELIGKFMRLFEAGSVGYIPQDDEKATYCHMIKKEDGIINWNESASSIERKIRAYSPWPGCRTSWKGRNILITKASLYAENPESPQKAGFVSGTDRERGILIQTGKGVLAAEKLKPETKNEMDWKSFLNGTKNFIGTTLGDKL